MSSRRTSLTRGRQAPSEHSRSPPQGGHHVALLGRAGVGKTLLPSGCRAFARPWGRQALEVTSIHQLTGKGASIAVDGGLIRRPPWFYPHRTASRAAMVGGGSDNRPAIGMVSLAHHGARSWTRRRSLSPVFSMPCASRSSRGVTIARAGFQLNFPARFQFGARDPYCPCGNALDTHRGALCRCLPPAVAALPGRLSGPLLDRVDVRVVLRKPSLANLRRRTWAQESPTGDRRAVAQARSCIRERLRDTPWDLMVSVPGGTSRAVAALPGSAANA